MNRNEIIALLKEWGVTVQDAATDADLKAMLAKGKPEAAKPATVPAPAAGVTAEEFRAEKRRRVRAEVLRLGENKIPNDKVEVWTDRALAGNEADVLAEIQALNPVNTGGEGLSGNRIEYGHDGANFAGLNGPKSAELVNLYKQHKTAGARHAAKRDDWKQLLDIACRQDNRNGKDVFAANTYSGTLVTSFLMDGSVTDLQNMVMDNEVYSGPSHARPADVLRQPARRRCRCATASLHQPEKLGPARQPRRQSQ